MQERSELHQARSQLRSRSRRNAVALVAAEISGGIGGFIVGFLLYLAVALISGAMLPWWLPFATLLAGALGMRVIAKRHIAPSDRKFC